MEDDASCILHISDTSLLVNMSAAYPQSHSLWQISLPSPDLISCVIYPLHRKPCERAILKMRDIRSSTSSGLTSDPPCKSTLLSKIHPSLVSISSKSTGTESVMPSKPNRRVDHLGKELVSQAWGVIMTTHLLEGIPNT